MTEGAIASPDAGYVARPGEEADRRWMYNMMPRLLRHTGIVDQASLEQTPWQNISSGLRTLVTTPSLYNPWARVPILNDSIQVAEDAEMTMYGTNGELGILVQSVLSRCSPQEKFLLAWRMNTAMLPDIGEAVEASRDLMPVELSFKPYELIGTDRNREGEFSRALRLD